MYVGATWNKSLCDFYSAPQSMALKVLYMLRQICPSVCLSVHHTPVLYQNEGMQRDALFAIG